MRTIPFLPGRGWPASRHTPCESTALVSTVIGRATGVDGTLGAGYLPGHVWTFDYPRQALWMEPASWTPDARAHRTPLGHLRNQRGGWATGMPRIRVRIAGQAVDLLLDTGATGKPSAAGRRASHEPTTAHGIGVTSYITTSVLDRWHREHPGWRVVEAGDQLFGARHATRMIEVPRVDIAGWRVGPVWFTERADANFHDVMSRYTDRRIEGSAGANIFRHFTMTLDYPRGAAWFTCVTGCRAAPGQARDP